MKKILSLVLALAMLAVFFVSANAEDAAAVADGVYTAEFHTDSSMFHVNEAKEGRGILTVKDGVMTIHISLASRSILNLYPGLKEDAEKEDAVLLEHTEDPVTYADGFSEKVFGFDVPVPVLDEEFDLALIGKKGKWYDHKVYVTDPQVYVPADGSYTVELEFAGGSGKSYVISPCTLLVEDGKMTAEITWSSSKYDYMLVEGQRYDAITMEGGSVFRIPVGRLGAALPVIGDTIAMSTPHEIEYTLNFLADTLQEVG